jgi:hypothetical protein
LSKFKLDNIDKFINALEEMIDARDDMWEEEKHHNLRHMLAIKEERYLPAREQLKQAIHNFIAGTETEQ